MNCLVLSAPNKLFNYCGSFFIFYDKQRFYCFGVAHLVCLERVKLIRKIFLSLRKEVLNNYEVLLIQPKKNVFKEFSKLFLKTVDVLWWVEVENAWKTFLWGFLSVSEDLRNNFLRITLETFMLRVLKNCPRKLQKLKLSSFSCPRQSNFHTVFLLKHHQSFNFHNLSIANRQKSTNFNYPLFTHKIRN